MAKSWLNDWENEQEEKLTDTVNQDATKITRDQPGTVFVKESRQTKASTPKVKVEHSFSSEQAFHEKCAIAVMMQRNDHLLPDDERPDILVVSNVHPE